MTLMKYCTDHTSLLILRMTLNCKTQILETTATPTQHNTLYKWLNFNVHCLPDHSVSMNSSSFHKENSDTIMKPAFLKSPLHHRHNFILYVSLYRFHLSHICIFCTSLFCNVDSSSRRKLEIKLKGTWACGPNVNVYVTTARIYPTEVFFCCCAAVQHHLSLKNHTLVAVVSDWNCNNQQPFFSLYFQRADNLQFQSIEKHS